ncbi:MAG: YqaA family protein [Terriglobales bacterium]
MGAIKKLLAKWAAFLWAVLQPLGSWGVFAIAAIDSAFFGMPLDAVVGGYVYANPHLFWLYAIMAAAGSAVGSLVIYFIGYEMGELVLEKRMGKAKFARVRARFERHEFLALAVPAVMPPPFPFKLFALSAAVFEMHWAHFLLAIFTGRIARFLLLSALVIYFGKDAVNMVGHVVQQHGMLVLVAFVVVVAIGVFFFFRGKKKKLAADER